VTSASSAPPEAPVAPRKVIAPRAAGEPQVVVVTPEEHFPDTQPGSVALDGFGFSNKYARVVQGKNGSLVVASRWSLDGRQAAVTRLDGRQALIDLSTLSLTPLGQYSYFHAVGPRFLAASAESLALLDRATGKELAKIEYEETTDLITVTPDALLLENYSSPDPASALAMRPGAPQDRVRLLSVPDLKVLHKSPARTLFRLPGGGDVFLLESWKKSPGGPVHELHELDAKTAKITRTHAVPRGSGVPLPNMGMDSPPRHAFAASHDGARVAMAFGGGVWELDRKTSRWKTLLPLPKPKEADALVDEYFFEVSYTPSGEVCVEHSGKLLVFPPPQVPPGMVLRAVSNRGCRLFQAPIEKGFEPVLPSKARRYEQSPTDVSEDGRLALSLSVQSGRGDESAEYRVTIIDLASGREVRTFSVGKRSPEMIDDRLFINFSGEKNIFAYAMGGKDFGGLFDLEGKRLSPPKLDEAPRFTLDQVIERLPLPPGSRAARAALQTKGDAVHLLTPSGEKYPVKLPEHRLAKEARWLQRERLALCWEDPFVLVLHVPPGPDARAEHVATLAPRAGGVVTLLRGGGFHAEGVADEELGCLSGETLAPVAACRERFFAEDGLRRLLTGQPL